MDHIAHPLARALAHIVRHAVEEMGRTLFEIHIVHPAVLDQREIEMVLEHALDRPGLRAFCMGQPGIEIEIVRALDMAADEGRIAQPVRAHLDEGILPFGASVGRARSNL